MVQPRSAQPAGVKGFFAAENYTVAYFKMHVVAPCID